MKPIEVLIFSHEGFESGDRGPKARYTSTNWNIRLDILADQTSDFELATDKHVTVVEGDRILIRYIDQQKWSYNQFVNLIYYGYVERYEDNKITARDIRSLFRTTVPTVPADLKDPMTKDPIAYVYEGIRRYVSKYNYMENRISIYKSPEVIPWAYHESEIKTVDFSSVLQKIFKQYQVLANIHHYDTLTSTNSFVPDMQIGRNYEPKVTIYTESTEPSVLEVSMNSISENSYNHVTVINTAERNRWAKKVVYSEGWWHGVWTKPTCVLFDEEIDNDTEMYKRMEELGKQYLDTGMFDHEITLGISSDTLYTLGQLVKIVHKGEVIESIISSIEYTSTNPYAKIKCGNVRTELEILL